MVVLNKTSIPLARRLISYLTCLANQAIVEIMIDLQTELEFFVFRGDRS